MAIPSKSFIIAGTHSGVGKTTIALGLMTALRKRSFTVQPFKAGPDYIDPSFHRLVCGRPSYNLDTWMMGVDGVKKTFAKAMQVIPPHPPLVKGGRGDFRVGIIEGVMGLFDGKEDSRDCSPNSPPGSTAHIAKVLGLPVILIVDAKAMAQSAGAIVYGFERFDPDVKIAGVIFNRVGSERHFEMLKVAVEKRCRAKVLGYIPRDEEISLPERHLGLVMAGDRVVSGQWSVVNKRLVSLIERFVDIEGILRINERLVAAPFTGASLTQAKACGYRRLRGYTTRIAVALDNAFCFYYQENLDMLKKFGAEIVFFSPLKDKRLPDGIKGIYFGGGYPELYAKRLSANKSLKVQIKDLAERNISIYAECGGLMYLGKGLKDLKGRRHDMVGLFPYISEMSKKRMTLGYREVIAADGCPFLSKGQNIRGHEFHYSNIDEPPHRIKRVYQLAPDRIIQGLGEDSFRNKPALECFYRGEGYLYKNTLVSYIHLHFASNPGFAEGFVEKCRGY
ncbi:MAG: cobyrinate a,c-diamide synthase [Nitrospinae bacterium]|nr:cobyrinate a,c-diamide synthase [Nitrospinota bacterium]